MHTLYIAQGIADTIRKRAKKAKVKKIFLALNRHDFYEKDFIVFHLKEILGQSVEIKTKADKKTYIDKIEIR